MAVRANPGAQKIYQMTVITGGMGRQGVINAQAGQHRRWEELKAAKAEGYTHVTKGGKAVETIDTAIGHAWSRGAQAHIKLLREEARWGAVSSKIDARKFRYHAALDAAVAEMKWQKSSVSVMVRRNFYTQELGQAVLKGYSHAQFFVSQGKSDVGSGFCVVHRPSGKYMMRYGSRQAAKRYVWLLLRNWPFWDYTDPEAIPEAATRLAEYYDHSVANGRVPWGWVGPDAPDGRARFSQEQSLADKHVERGYHGHRKTRPVKARNGQRALGVSQGSARPTHLR